MKTTVLAAVMSLATPAAVHAHEIWVEREGSGPARIYLGEPAQPLPEGGDPEFSKLKSPKILSASDAPQVRKAGFIEVAVPAGDVRLIDDNVFAPWGKAENLQSVVYYARGGRSEATTALPFEFMPDVSGSSRFLLIRDGKPQPVVEVNFIDPARVETKLKTDEAGAVTVPTSAAGRYLLTASIKDEGLFQTPAGPVAVLHHITTISFVAR